MCRDHGIDSGGQLVDSDPLLADVTQPDLAWYLPLVRHHLAGSRSGQAQNTLGMILLAPDSRRAAQIHSTATDCPCLATRASAALGLGRSSTFLTVEAATNTSSSHRMFAMRFRPNCGFASKDSQIISAISLGVFPGLSFLVF